ncbi:MAG: hypothetical protein ACKVOI_02990 [Dongiaceae bacterium]
MGILGVKRFVEIFLRSFFTPKNNTLSKACEYPAGASGGELEEEDVDKEVHNSRLQQASLIRCRICTADTIV